MGNKGAPTALLFLSVCPPLPVGGQEEWGTGSLPRATPRPGYVPVVLREGESHW